MVSLRGVALERLVGMLLGFFGDGWIFGAVLGVGGVWVIWDECGDDGLEGKRYWCFKNGGEVSRWCVRMEELGEDSSFALAPRSWPAG